MRRWVLPGAVLALATAVASCGVVPTTNQSSASPAKSIDVPVSSLDEEYLGHSTDDAVEAVSEARKALEADSPDVAAARIALDRAAGALNELTEFYIPLTEARDDLITAYMDHVAGRAATRDKYLEAAAVQLSWVVEHTPPGKEESSTSLLTLLNALDGLDRTTDAFTAQLAKLCQEVQNRLQNAPETVFRSGGTTPTELEAENAAAASGADTTREGSGTAKTPEATGAKTAAGGR